MFCALKLLPCLLTQDNHRMLVTGNTIELGIVTFDICYYIQPVSIKALGALYIAHSLLKIGHCYDHIASGLLTDVHSAYLSCPCNGHGA